MLIKDIKKHIVKIEFWRLIFFVLKRGLSVTKIVVQRLPISLVPFVYILHFLRAFLRIFNYFYGVKNKNAGETAKLLFAIFKVTLALLALVFFAYNLLVPATLLSLFLTYSIVKIVYSAIILLSSAYAIFSKKNKEEIDWLRACYKDNLKKHLLILSMGIGIMLLTLLVTVLSGGGVFIFITVLLSFFTLVDATLAVYYYFNASKVLEPKPATLSQKNSLIDFSFKDYYYRKCRLAMLVTNDLQVNKVYLLKEIFVKIIQLENKITGFLMQRIKFFSGCFLERKKIEEKIFFLTREGGRLLNPSLEDNINLFKQLINCLNKDHEEVGSADRIIIPTFVVEKQIKRLQASLEELENPGKSLGVPIVGGNILWTFLLAYDEWKTINYKNPGPLFYQSFSKKMGDCEDIQVACRTLETMDIDPVSQAPSTYLLSPIPRPA